MPCSRGCALGRGVPGPGGSVPGGVCLVWGVPGPGGAWWRPPRRLLLWAVRILLECILVSIWNYTKTSGVKKNLITNNVSLFSGVAFRAEIKVHADYSEDDRVVFAKINSNIGNGYDSNTGIFTVPHNGTYDLTLTNMGRLGAINTNLMRNHKRLCGSYAKESHTIGKPDQRHPQYSNGFTDYLSFRSRKLIEKRLLP